MNKQQIIISSISIETNPELTLEELCSACRVAPEFVYELIEFGVLEVDENAIETYRFNSNDLRRIRAMAHLKNDLEVNLPGAALIVDLLEEMDEMRAKIDMLEKLLR